VDKKEIVITEQTAQEMDNVFENKERELEEKVEAALFISGKFLNIQELIMLTDINPIMLKEILNRLEKKYAAGAVILVNKNNSWKMDVAEKYHYLINKLATGKTEFTKAEQETLAIIAYKQPVKQSIIVKIRGNKAYDHVKKFIELNLVKTKKVGHTIDLELSEDFYEYFNVQKKLAEETEESDATRGSNAQWAPEETEASEQQPEIQENSEEQPGE
jgi:segregation and condensation protein B